MTDPQISVALEGLATSTGTPVDNSGNRRIYVSDETGRLSGWYTVRDGALMPENDEAPAPKGGQGTV